MKKPELTEQLITNILETNGFVISQCDLNQDQLAEIAKCYFKNIPADGYEFMYSLSVSPYHWEGDFETSEMLEEIIYQIERGYLAALSQWVKDNNIQPKYNAGDEVENTDYVILGLDSYRPYTYKIQFKNSFPSVGSNSYIQLWFDQVEVH